MSQFIELFFQDKLKSIEQFQDKAEIKKLYQFIEQIVKIYKVKIYTSNFNIGIK